LDIKDIQLRENQRRRALWRLAALAPGDTVAFELIQVIDEIDQAELDDDSLATKILGVEDVLIQVAVEPHPSTMSIVRVEDISQPWRARFLAASIASTRVAEGFYADDWHSFLRKWETEMRHVAEHRTARGVSGKESK
jgi:hypothetical protein